MNVPVVVDRGDLHEGGRLRSRLFLPKMDAMTETTPTPEVPAEDVASKRLTGREYARAKTMYQSGEYSLSEISDEVGVSATALSRRFKRDGVTKGSDATRVSAAVKRAIEQTSAAHAKELAETAHDIKMQALKALKLFNQKAYSDVATAIRDKKDLAEQLNSLKALEVASKIISTNYGTGARILGLDKDVNPDDDLPELHIKLMTENDVAEMRERHEQEERDAEDTLDDDEIFASLSNEELEDIDKAISDGTPVEAE